MPTDTYTKLPKNLSQSNEPQSGDMDDHIPRTSSDISISRRALRRDIRQHTLQGNFVRFRRRRQNEGIVMIGHYIRKLRYSMERALD